MTDQESQCQAFSECENTPGPDGYCEVHPRRRRQVRMTPAELREHGVDITISHGGAVVRQRDLKDANEAFSDTLPDVTTND